jgi:cyclic beta-1,2-glucan synthetase
MAHHQGMTIVSIANTLHDGQMRARFHREPMIQACELLLQERMPRDVAVAHPRAEEVKASAVAASTEAPTARRLTASASGVPITHLLSNGRYAVMLTAAGGHDPRRLGFVHLPAGYAERKLLVCWRATGRKRCGIRRSRLR